MDICLAKIEAVLKEHPTLDADGYFAVVPKFRFGRPFNLDQAYLTSDDGVRQIEIALEFISKFCKKSFKVLKTKGTSYGWKHQVEHWCAKEYPGKNNYVSNGAFIIAAIILGYKFIPASEPNCYFNMV